MPASACVRCGVVSDSVAESGLCATCLGRPDETHVAENAAGTVTRDPPTAATRSAGEDGAGGVLPPGGYRYVELLGGGGMGVVWRAVRVSTGQTVAIKKLRPEGFTPAGLRRFVTEARTLAAVRHDGVVQLHDFVPDPADPFIVMEFVPGHSLADQLKQSGPLHPDRAARLVAASARGVQAAHEAGVIHRDLKPANLLVTPAGQVKVADFGLGKRLVDVEAAVLVGAATVGGESPAAETVTRTGQLAGGTPGFMAPEQVDGGFGQADRLTDVWGLGACLYALLTNRAPFPSGKSNVHRVLTDSLVPPHEVNPTIPADLAAIVVKCLQKDPASRYPSAAALADDLDRFVDRDSTVARPKGWPARAWRRLRRTPRAVVIAVAVAALAVIVGGSLAMVPWRTPVDPVAKVQERLKAGEEVVLVDAGKFLLPPKWLVGDTTLTDPTAEEATSFASRELALLQVLSNADLDHYRITARVRQLPTIPGVAAPVNSRVSLLGVFWGYRETAMQDGWRARAFMALGYNDFCPPNLKPNPRLSHYDIGLLDSPLDSLSPLKQMGPNSALVVVPALPGPTRTLVVDVNPDQIVLHLTSGPHVITAQSLAANCRELELGLQQIGKDPGRKFGTEEWSPKAPVGVFVDRTRIAVERFVITPLTPD